jgi:DNA helicase-2/ATP-dependent DNA helicase PcrA
MSDLLNTLNLHQKEAATFGGRFLLVLAGAGSGKTKTLISRIVHEVQSGVNPNSIIAVTFTNKAAREVKERIVDALKGQSQGIYVGTFHRISNMFLRRYGHLVGLSPTFQIITPSDQKKIFKAIFARLNHPEHGSYQHKNALGVLSAYYKKSQMPTDRHWHDVIDMYIQQMQQDQLLDFDGLIEKALLLYNHPEFQQAVVPTISHLLIDEFQDTNPAQLRWIQSFLTQGAKATLVGDDDQSIYGFRGADISIIQSASLLLEGLWTIKLEQNYRSTPSILNLANASISKNIQRLGKDLWTANSDENKPRVVECLNEYHEAQEVCRKIHQLLHTGVLHQDIAVLYRSNALSRLLEGEARKYQWPYHISGGLPFFDREEIRDIMSYLQVIDNPHQSNALDRIINKPSRKIGQKTQDTILEYRNKYQVSYWDAMLSLLLSFPPQAQKALKEFMTLIEELRTCAQLLALPQLADLIVAKTQLLQSYVKSDQGDQKADNIYQFHLALKDYEAQYQGPPDKKLTAFLNDYLLDDTQVAELGSSLVFSTCHAAKGLEWPYVFIIGAEKEYFPHEHSQSEEQIEEERRLFYVAVTRAKKQLIFFYAKQRQKYQEMLFPKKSPFLEEIPQHLLEWEYLKQSDGSQGIKNYNISARTDNSSDSQRILNHPVFGKGVVLDLDFQNDVIKVRFAHLGTKVFRYSLCRGLITQ